MIKGTIFWNSMFLVLTLVIILSAVLTFSSLASATYNSTGGNVTYDGLYTVVTFPYNGTFTWIGDSISDASVLVVAGGGAGGGSTSNFGGGGGAGGLLYSNAGVALSAQAYTVIIGVGGTGVVANTAGKSGQNSSFGTLFYAFGGGGGGAGAGSGQQNGKDGGSSGGGAWTGGLGGTKFQNNQTPAIGYGMAGGNAAASGSAGGGGAWENGATGASQIGGAGGNGTAININGTSTYYSGGGGGGGANDFGIGGLGGGGAGGGVAGSSNGGVNALANTGGGGGGVGYNGTGGTYKGGNGGSGIVIIRYLTNANPIPFNTSSLKNVALNTSWGDTWTHTHAGNQNYGTGPDLQPYSTQQHVYIWFNLSQYTNVTFTNVTFNWYKINGTNDEVRYWMCNSSFNELNLTWNNEWLQGIQCNSSYSNGTIINWQYSTEPFTINGTSVNGWNYDIWSQLFYNQLKEKIQHGDGVWTFLIAGDQNPYYSSKEGAEIPWLNLTYYDTFVVNSTYKQAIVENVNNAYNLTVKINASVSNVTAVFVYNGSSYTPSYTSSAGNWFNFTHSLRPASVTEPWNTTRQLSWTINVSYVDGSSTLYTTNTQNQNIYRPVINMSNAPGNGEATRFFICKDEITSAVVNCNFTSTWNIFAPENYGSAYYRTYTNTTYNVDTFYQYPPAAILPKISNLTASYNVSAVATGYPQRNFVLTGENLNGTNMTKTFLMLSSTDGIYVTFQVLTNSYNPIPGVSVIVNRTSDGALVGQGITGPSGTVTFWMNPNVAHTVTFSHPSYPTVIFTDTFTQPQYTVFMGATGSMNVTNNYTGINYIVTPAYTAVLSTYQKYNFSLYLESNTFNVTAFGYNLTDGSGNVYASNLSLVNGTNITSMNFNVSGNTTIQMHVWWIIDGTLTEPIIDWHPAWYYEGTWSIMHLIDDLRAYNSGPNPLLNTFTMSLIAFAIIFLITGALCWVSGIYSPLAIGSMICSLTWFFAWVGMIGNPTSAPAKYAIPAVLTVLFGAYYIWEQTR